jgi:type I restriction enzyme M protein
MTKRHSAGKDARGAVARIEEIVIASSGADAFELVFALAAARLVPERASLSARIETARKRWPWLHVRFELEVPPAVLAEVERLLDAVLFGPCEDARRATRAGRLPEPRERRVRIDLGEGLDAVFEQLVTRVGKGEKGQFFTPRHVVDFVVRALGINAGETVVDPACGSGAFLAHARARAPRAKTWGADVDLRAVRVAKLLALATGADPALRVRADALADSARWPKAIDVIATNPPFAGDHARAGFELARLVRAERDAFFLERSIARLRAGGRIAIVLPHGKVASSAWSPLRRWLVERARVFAVVSLPRETFMPHTGQKTAIVFAKKRGPARDPRERVFFATSERAGKDAAGEPTSVGHDLDEIAPKLARFLSAEGFYGSLDMEATG